MPVHHDWSAAHLLVAVDGDFTVAELERVVRDALISGPDDGAAGAPDAGILLDLTGAASLANKPDEELRRAAAFFASLDARYRRIALLIAGDVVDDMMRLGTAFIAQDGLKATPFRDRAEAESWLGAAGPARD